MDRKRRNNFWSRKEIKINFQIINQKISNWLLIADSAPIESSVKNPASAPFGINSASSTLSRILRYMTLAMAALTILISYLFEQVWQWGDKWPGVTRCDHFNVQRSSRLAATTLPKKEDTMLPKSSQSEIGGKEGMISTSMKIEDLLGWSYLSMATCSAQSSLPIKLANCKLHCVRATSCFLKPVAWTAK